MAIIKVNNQNVVVCDICGRQSPPMKNIAKMPNGFSSATIGDFLNLCDDCKAQIISDVDRLKKLRRAG